MSRLHLFVSKEQYLLKFIFTRLIIEFNASNSFACFWLAYAYRQNLIQISR